MGRMLTDLTVLIFYYYILASLSKFLSTHNANFIVKEVATKLITKALNTLHRQCGSTRFWEGICQTMGSYFQPTCPCWEKKLTLFSSSQ